MRIMALTFLKFDTRGDADYVAVYRMLLASRSLHILEQEHVDTS